MTEYEMADLLTSIGMGSLEALSTYLSVTIAYLVAVYLVGRKLTTLQMTTVSILYVVSAAMLAWAFYSYFSRAIPIADALEVINPGVNYGAQPFARNAFVIVLFMGIFACLGFMWNIRHRKVE